MRLKELKKLAKHLGVKGYSRMNKEDLEKICNTKPSEKTLKLLEKLYKDNPWITMIGLKRIDENTICIISFEPSGRGDPTFMIGTISDTDSALTINNLYKSLSYVGISKDLKMTFPLPESFDPIFQQYKITLKFEEQNQDVDYSGSREMEERIAEMVMRSVGLAPTRADEFGDIFFTGTTVNGKKEYVGFYL